MSPYAGSCSVCSCCPHDASVEPRDRLAQRHPWLGQDDDQCARAAPDPDSRVFDAEKVGEALIDITLGLPATDNFQHWPPWRALVVETARRVFDYTGGTLGSPMTVLVERYRREITSGFAQHAIPVRHFVLPPTRKPSAGASRGTLFFAPSPRSVSNTLSRTPRRRAGKRTRDQLLALGAWVDPFDGAVRPPSEKTIRWVLAGLDPDALVTACVAWTLTHLPATADGGPARGEGEGLAATLTALAMDGKCARGAKGSDGSMPQSAVTHEQSVVVAQTQIPDKTRRTCFCRTCGPVPAQGSTPRVRERCPRDAAADYCSAFGIDRTPNSLSMMATVDVEALVVEALAQVGITADRAHRGPAAGSTWCWTLRGSISASRSRGGRW